MPPLRLWLYSKSYGVVPSRHIMRSVTIRALTEISGLTSRGVLQNARKMVDSIMFAIRRTRRAFCKTPLLVRLRARLGYVRTMCLEGTTP